MGADNSRLFSPSEEDHFPVHGYKRMRSERREATSTIIDVGFAIRARSCKAGMVGTGLVSSGGEPGMLQRMVSGRVFFVCLLMWLASSYCGRPAEMETVV